MKYIKNIIRAHIPIEIRLLREAIKIYFYKKLNRRNASITPKEFPLDLVGNVAFYTHPFLKKNGNKYFAQIYGADKVTDTTIHQRGYLHFITEVIAAEMYKKECVFTTTSEVVVPVSIPDKNTDIVSELDGKLIVKVDDSLIQMRGVKKNSFHYLSFPEKKNININTTNNNIIVGKPILKKSHIATNKKIVISIFIDGLGAEIFNKKDFYSIMPSTANYFSDGLIFFNGYANANWTLPSAPSIMSGLYTINHGVYHSTEVQHIGEGYNILSEYFKDSGYLTCRIDNCMRQSPLYNYSKGFDRTLYKHSMSCKDVVTNAIEHLTAFKERDNYLWLSFMDLHHDLYGMPDTSTQVNMPLSIYDFTSPKVKNPFISFDEKAIERYSLEITRLDMYLGILYDFIKSNYTDNEVVVSICSDHGRGFLGTDEERLAEHRIKVPMLFKSSNIESSISDEIIEDIDYLPALFKAAGLNVEYGPIDGRVPYAMGGKTKKTFAISEDIHQDAKYYAAVYGAKYILFVESAKIIDNIENIDFMDCKYRLFDRKSNNIIETGVCSHPSDASDAYVLFLKKHRIRIQ